MTEHAAATGFVEACTSELRNDPASKELLTQIACEVQVDPAALKAIDSTIEEINNDETDQRRAGKCGNIKVAQELAFQNPSNAIIVVFEDEASLGKRTRTVKVDGIRITGRGRETNASVFTLLFDPNRNSTKGWLFLIPKSVLGRPGEPGDTHTEESAEKHRLQIERWSKAITVYSVSHAIAITKLVWHKLSDKAEELLNERDSIIAHDAADQHVAFWNNGVIDKIWLLNLGSVYFSAYSQYFFEKGVTPATSELVKYEDLIIIEKDKLKVAGKRASSCQAPTSWDVAFPRLSS